LVPKGGGRVTHGNVTQTTSNHWMPGPDSPRAGQRFSTQVAFVGPSTPPFGRSGGALLHGGRLVVVVSESVGRAHREDFHAAAGLANRSNVLTQNPVCCGGVVRRRGLGVGWRWWVGGEGLPLAGEVVDRWAAGAGW